MDVTSDHLLYLMLWVVVISVTLRQTWTGRQRGAGLVLAYLFQLWLLHWVAALIHILPWAFLPNSEFATAGFREATWGLCAFGAGFIFGAPALSSRLTAQRCPEGQPPDSLLPLAYAVGGIASFAVLAPTIGRLPSLGALTGVGTQLFVLGICLGCWKAWAAGRKTEFVMWLAASLPLPAITVMVMGFLGFGTIAFFIVMIFVAHFFRPRWVLVAGCLVGSYVGLSVFVNYMSARMTFRQQLQQGASYSDRMDVILEAFESARWFDPGDQSHLEAIDDRLNQNTLTGAAVNHLNLTGDYAKGETIWMGLIAMVPRLIWPDKPVFAGSMGLASRFTGLQFAEGTSVGMGPVFELYANFGRLGVLVGFLVLGALVGGVDHVAGYYLRSGDWHGFSLWYLIGLGFLQVGGSFVEVGGSVAAAVALGYLMRWALRRQNYHSHVIPRPYTPY